MAFDPRVPAPWSLPSKQSLPHNTLLPSHPLTGFLLILQPQNLTFDYFQIFYTVLKLVCVLVPADTYTADIQYIFLV